MDRFQERLAGMRQEWIGHGQRAEDLIPPLLAVLADAWLYRASGGKRKRRARLDPGGALQGYIDKSLEGKDVNGILAERRVSPRCGETYRLENMATCTQCLTSICWRCEAMQTDNICGCGGERY